MSSRDIAEVMIEGARSRHRAEEPKEVDFTNGKDTGAQKSHIVRL